MRVAIDTNLLAYAEGVNTAAQQQAAIGVLRGLPREAIVVPVQVLGELFNVLVRRGGFSTSEAHAVVQALHETVRTVATSPDVMRSAIDLDAIIAFRSGTP